MLVLTIDVKPGVSASINCASLAHVQLLKYFTLKRVKILVWEHLWQTKMLTYSMSFFYFYIDMANTIGVHDLVWVYLDR